MSNTSREIRSEVTSDGQLKLSIESVEMPTPKDHEVLLKVEASPINPSDLGLLISFAADLSSITTEGSGDNKVTTMSILPALHKTMTARFDKSMKDLVNFLAYAAEPARITREKNGVFVILFFIVFTAVMNLLYREYAKELK